LKFLKPYSAEVRDLALATRALVFEEAPDASELIYDAYSAVASGYTFTGRPSDAFIHIAVYARWVNLGFNRGSQIPDPFQMLHGSGRSVRHIRISELADLQQPAVRALVRAAIAEAERPEKTASASAPKSVVRAVYPTRRRPVRQSS
jgi:hypothetical protein